jgi:hypothetical protein
MVDFGGAFHEVVHDRIGHRQNGVTRLIGEFLNVL